VSNAWAFFDMTLVEERTGRTREFSDAIGYYHGWDGGESWSEGSRRGGASVPRVPPGRYRLVVNGQGSTPVGYSIQATHGSPALSLYLIALLVLLVPPAWRTIAGAVFEHNRWMESDYPPAESEEDE
jgi:hypothetical protein